MSIVRNLGLFKVHLIGESYRPSCSHLALSTIRSRRVHHLAVCRHKKPLNHDRIGSMLLDTSSFLFYSVVCSNHLALVSRKLWTIILRCMLVSQLALSRVNWSCINCRIHQLCTKAGGTQPKRLIILSRNTHV